MRKPLVYVVCFANYCRSPVAEFLLREKYVGLIDVKSAGIKPIIDSKMDGRSRAFLSEKGFNDLTHTPRKITQKIVSNADLILCMDHMILMTLNQLFPRAKNKFKIFTFESSVNQIDDPFQMDSEGYIKIMNDIEKTVDELNFTF